MSKITQNQIIKDHLLSGQPITSWQAITDYHITRLAKCVHELRQAGMNIQSKTVKENGKHFSRYWVNKADDKGAANEQI